MFGYSMPDKPVCHSHNCTLDFLADAFFERYPNILVLANRTGGKTLAVAILNVLEAIFKPGCGIASLAGSKSQASKQYEYSQQAFINNKYLWDKFIASSLQSVTKLKNQSYFHILPTSHTAVHSPHLPKLRIDEVDEIEDVRIFNASLSIPLSDRARGIKANTLMTSTRHKPFGLMRELVDTSLEKHRKLVQFCYKESSERCPDYLSGDVPTTFYINSSKRSLISPKKFLNLVEAEQSGYNRYKMFNKCVKCELAPSCRGDLKRASGFYAIDDLINKYINMPTESWESEWECRIPSMGDLVYSCFDENFHVRPHEYDPALRTYCGIDFGYVNFYAVWFQVGINGEIYIFDEYSDPRTITEHRAGIMRERPYYNVKYWGDPAGARMRDEVSGLTAVQEYKHNGIMINTRNVDPKNRQRFLRNKMKIVDGRTHFFVDSKKCPIFYKSILSYHFRKDRDGLITDEPVRDMSAHALDGLEYSVVGCFGVGKSYYY
jgi:hypothetical protein